MGVGTQDNKQATGKWRTGIRHCLERDVMRRLFSESSNSKLLEEVDIVYISNVVLCKHMGHCPPIFPSNIGNHCIYMIQAATIRFDRPLSRQLSRHCWIRVTAPTREWVWQQVMSMAWLGAMLYSFLPGWPVHDFQNMPTCQHICEI